MKIGRYEIERELGRGAMGVVYLATDPRVKRRVAIKTWHAPEGLKPELQAEFRERFLREAQAAGALSHPAIVTIYDADDDREQDLPYIAMEYVEGRSLERVLAEDGPVDPELAFAQAEAVAGALGAAHAAGIVHRDIKPANLLIPAGSTIIKVADFGVARMASSELTRTGNSLGSPAYMSPEQVRGLPADGRSDLFALAVVLYESLCGERPFRGNDLTSLAFAVVHESHIPISRKKAGLPPGLDAFFDRALAKDPEKRYRDAGEFVAALEAARKEAACAATRTLTSCDGSATEVEAGAGPADPATPAAGPSGPARALSPDPAAGSGPVAGHGPAPPAQRETPHDRTAISSRSPAERSRERSQGESTARPPDAAEAAVAAGAAKMGVLSVRATRALAAAVAFVAPKAGRLAVRAGRAMGRALAASAAWLGRCLPVAGRRIRRADRRVLAAAAALAVTGLIVAAVWFVTLDDVTLAIEGKNGFPKAEVTILVDGEAVWSKRLSAEKKTASIFGRDLFDYGSSEFFGSIRVEPGKREISVEVLPKGEKEPYRDIIRKNLKPGTRRTLEITTGKGLGRTVSVDLD